MEEHDYMRLDLGDIISKTWKIYTRNFVSILIITLIIYVPINIILFFVSYANGEEISLPSYFRLIQLSESLFGIIAVFAIIFITAKAVGGERLSPGSALKMSFEKWGSGILTNIVQGFILFLLLILLIVPGLIWIVYYSFTSQIVALNDLKYKRALDYSKSLVKGNWWRTLGYSIVIALVPGAFAITISYSVSFATGGYNGIELLEIFINTMTDILLSFSTVGMTVLFLEMEKYRMPELPILNAYEQMNSFVNKGSEIDEDTDMADDNVVEEVEENEEGSK